MPLKKIGQQTWALGSEVHVLSSAAVVGPKEGKGLLKDDYDVVYPDLYAGQDTWERAERKMMEDAVDFAIHKSGVDRRDIELYIAGDLLNQNITASFSARTNQLPFIGVFGACSTSMQSVTLAAALIDGGFIDRALVAVSSHNATAEKQFRYPTEYGSQRPATSGWTTTGAGAAVLGEGKIGPRVTYCTVGKVVDWGIQNPDDLGSAMAPAAVDTIVTHFSDTGRNSRRLRPRRYGRLARVGFQYCERSAATKKDRGRRTLSRLWIDDLQPGAERLRRWKRMCQQCRRHVRALVSPDGAGQVPPHPGSGDGSFVQRGHVAARGVDPVYCPCCFVRNGVSLKLKILGREKLVVDTSQES